MKEQKKMKNNTCSKLRLLLNQLNNGKELSVEQHLRLQNILISYSTCLISLLNEDVKIKILYYALEINSDNVGDYFISIWKNRLTIMALFDSKFEYEVCFEKMMKEANVVKHKHLFKRAREVQTRLHNFHIGTSISEMRTNKMDIMLVGKNNREASCTDNEKLGNFLVFWSNFINSRKLPFENCLRIACAGSRMSIYFHEAKLVRDCGGKNAVSPFQKFDTFGFHTTPIWFINTSPCNVLHIKKQALRLR